MIFNVLVNYKKPSEIIDVVINNLTDRLDKDIEHDFVGFLLKSSEIYVDSDMRIYLFGMYIGDLNSIDCYAESILNIELERYVTAAIATYQLFEKSKVEIKSLLGQESPSVKKYIFCYLALMYHKMFFPRRHSEFRNRVLLKALQNEDTIQFDISGGEPTYDLEFISHVMFCIEQELDDENLKQYDDYRLAFHVFNFIIGIGKIGVLNHQFLTS